MDKRFKILILYHSGAGSTKTIAEILKDRLTFFDVDLKSINLSFDYSLLNFYDSIIFGFPTHHCSPSNSMKEFIEKMPYFKMPKQSFAFTTYGLYSGNTLREFSKICLKKNIYINDSFTYKGPSADGALLLPKINYILKYENNIVNKLKLDIAKIEHTIFSNSNKPSIPPIKIYTPFNYLNKRIGSNYKHRFKLLNVNCINCDRCVENCIRGCWKIGPDYPILKQDNCEFCFKCIHHCPTNAIILFSKTENTFKMNQKFYDKLKLNMLKEFEISR